MMRSSDTLSIKILAVDDDIGFCRSLCAQFASEFSIQAVHSASEALNSLTLGEADLLFLDIGLPDISGMDLLKMVRDLYPGLAVIMLTGSSDMKMYRMITWTHASQGDRRLLSVICELCEQHPKLIDFMFHPSKAELRASAQTLRRDVGCFSSGEQVLVSVAIDLWSSTDHVKLGELGRLDPFNFQRVITAFGRIRL